MRRARDEPDHDPDHDPGHDPDDDVPLHHRRPFGAGLKRQRVEFVKATDPDAGTSVQGESVQAHSGPSVEDIYAAIVLKPKPSATGSKSTPAEEATGKRTETEGTGETEAAMCPICSLPITGSARQHDASLAHQVSLAHSHPPSALDRSRMGLRALESQGWDPDSRLGLGREGEGVRFPIKTVRKEDTLGVGARGAKDVGRDMKKNKDKNKGGEEQKNEEEEEKERKKRKKPMTGKERKAFEERERRRGERLQAEIYGRVDVEKYLRGDAAI